MKTMSQTSTPPNHYSSKEKKHGKKLANKRPHLNGICSIGNILSSLRSKKLAKMAYNYEYKSSTSSSSRHMNKGPRRKSCHSCASMAFLAFGAAILGVIMVLQKLGEKRDFSLLVDVKDHDFLTLQLHFQREQEFNKEARKEIEEMKTDVYSLRSQNFELERLLFEMESTMTSLKDERKVLESTLEEKRNEIKMLTEARIKSTVSQVSTLQDVIRMKESEIEGLKLQLNKTYSSILQTGQEGVRVNDHTMAGKGEIGSKNNVETDTALYKRVAELTDNAMNDSRNDGHDAGTIGVEIQVRRRPSGSKRLRDGRKRRLGNGLYSETTDTGELKEREDSTKVQSDKLNQYQAQDTGSDSRN